LCDDSSDDLADINVEEIKQHIDNKFNDISREAVDDFFGYGFGFNRAKARAATNDLEFFAMCATNIPLEPLEDPEVHDTNSDASGDTDSDASGETVATEIVAIPVSPTKRAKVARRAVPGLKREGRIQPSQDKKSKGSYRPPENRNSGGISPGSDKGNPRKLRGMVDYIREALQKKASQNAKDEGIKMEDIKMEDIRKMKDIKMNGIEMED
jgi:hypothetical protein